jgi:hypothetical protein
MLEDRKEKITLQMVYKIQTSEAVLLGDDFLGEFWLPLSLIEIDLDNLERGDQVEVTLPKWLARERDLI